MLNMEVQYDPATPVSTQEKGHPCPPKNLYTIIHSSQKVETTQMPIKWYTDKQNVAHLYNEILFGHKKEWNTDTCYNMDESLTCHAKVGHDGSRL